MIKLTFCEIVGHRVNRKRVGHDGLHYRTNCGRCNSPLIRHAQGWVLFDPAAHADERRSQYEAVTFGRDIAA